MSDSDDDSLLGMETTFTMRRKSAREKSRASANAMKFLDDALDDDCKRRVLQDRMERIKQEEPEEEYLTQAETLANNAASNSSGAKRRREINDEIDGIGGEDTGFDQKRRAFLANVADTEKSTLLGVRQTFKFADDDKSSLWHSEQDAIRELKDLLKRIEKEHGANMKNAVTKPLRGALRENMLKDFLCAKTLVDTCHKYNQTILPLELCKWLFQVASSGGTGKMTDDLAIDAFDMLMGLWNEGLTSSEPAVTVSEIVTHLEQWFGLCWTATSDETENDTSVSPKEHPKAMGLRHYLTLCAKSLDLDALVESFPDDIGIASQCLVALQMAGLDVTFHSGRGLLKPLQDLLCSVFNSVATKLSPGKWNELMDSAANKMLDQCLTLGPGVPGTEDADDDKAWLCLSLVAQNFPSHAPEGPNNKVAEFKARLAIRALQLCLGLKDWEAHLKSILLENGNADLEKRSTESLRWKAIVSAYTGLISIDLQGDVIVMDGPRCLSTIENALHCAVAGKYLFSSSITSKEGSGGIYGSTEEADAMCHVLGLLENQCNQLMKRVKPMSSRPHYRRAAYHLSSLRTFYRHCQVNAANLAGHSGPRNIVQQSIDSFFSPSNDSDDESEELLSQ